SLSGGQRQRGGRAPPAAPRPPPPGARALAEAALRDGIWLAPGCYFDAAQADTPWLRFNVAYSNKPALWRFLRQRQA
ncbi:hypothetical protein WC434_16210, partial [Bordetella avium]